MKENLYTCTFNFCNENNWFEFYLNMSEKITDYQLKAAIILLNAGSKQVRDNSWTDFHRIAITKLYDNQNNPKYTYKMLQTKIFHPIVKEYNHNNYNNNLEYIYKTFCQVMLTSVTSEN